MAQIKVKGMNWLNVSYSSAKNLKMMMSNPKQDREEWVDIGDIFVQLKDISGVNTAGDKEYVSQDHTEDFKKFYNQERTRREKFLKLPPEDKAVCLGMFKTLYLLTTGEYVPDEETLIKAEDLQKTFYEKNPSRMYVDPNVFKELMQGKRPKISAVDSSVLGIIERTIQRDMYYK